ncbi:hypothetical protein C8R43DRAFT_964055 [Mycena crocata]|nr:hypothetical protein C8R43DRAFT_964055 [Mycena crocata]
MSKQRSIPSARRHYGPGLNAEIAGLSVAAYDDVDVLRCGSVFVNEVDGCGSEMRNIWSKSKRENHLEDQVKSIQTPFERFTVPDTIQGEVQVQVGVEADLAGSELNRHSSGVTVRTSSVVQEKERGCERESGGIQDIFGPVVEEGIEPQYL